MTYVVLGMHKSGTTLVAQLLHGSGIPMVEMVSSADYDTGNKWERASTVAFDNDILAAHDVESLWLRPPDAAGLLREEHVERARKLVARIDAETAAATRAEGEWGFKDPRACLAWPVWRRVLAAPRIVGVYRQPGAVVRHYHQHPPPGFRKRALWRWRVELLALRRWCEYNERILAAIDDAQGASILLSYERLMRDDEELARLRRFLGRDFADSRTPGKRAATGADGARARLGARIAQVTGAGNASATLARLEARRMQLLASPGAAEARQ
jgi:hypothetical protein